MIIDYFKNASSYYGVNPRLEKAFAWMLNTDLVNTPAGTYEVDGKEIVALVQEYSTTPPEGAEWECHEHHLDLQCMISGEEAIGYAPLEGTQPAKPYNEEWDYTILNRLDDVASWVTFSGKQFMILTPDDAHIPRVAAKTPGPVKKLVIKVLM
jgi:YhcH/YjgK/YiaL family protein